MLIAIDGSAPSLAAARYASLVFQGQPLDITVITAVGLPTGSLTASSGEAYSQFMAQSLKNDEKNYNAVVNMFDRDTCSLQHLIKHGHIGHCIVAVAEEMDADLVVMGASGSNRKANSTLGSVSEYVATHAVGSVLVVRSHVSAASESTPFKITVAYDDSQPAKKLVQILKTAPWARQAQLEVISVMAKHELQGIDQTSLAAHHQDDKLKHLTEAAEQVVLELRQSQLNASCKVFEAKSIGEQIVGFALQNHSDMIFMGAQGQSGFARSLMGSVAHHILRHATQSVWVVRSNNL